MNVNRIIISGNLVANPTARETHSGTPVTSATIANNEFFNDERGARQQITTFVDVIVWCKPGENFASLAKKGRTSLSKASCAEMSGNPKMASGIRSIL
jgi:single-strand DNA-binding protein